MPDDPYAAMADLYDLAYGDYVEDIDFYENLARATDGPVLELGVGTGRVAIPLAQAGHDVVGVDQSASMLVRARENLAAVRLRRVCGKTWMPDRRETVELSFIALRTSVR